MEEALVRYAVMVHVSEARFHTLDECVEYAQKILSVRPDADVTISNEYVIP